MLIEQNNAGSGGRGATEWRLFVFGCVLILVPGFVEVAVGKEPANDTRRKRNGSYTLRTTFPALVWPIYRAQDSRTIHHDAVPSVPHRPYWPLRQSQRFQSGTRYQTLTWRLRELRAANHLPPYGIVQATSSRSARASQPGVNMGRLISTSRQSPPTRTTGLNPLRHRTSQGVPITGTRQPAKFVRY